MKRNVSALFCTTLEPPVTTAEGLTCYIDSRVDCGYAGITREECLGYGCCWHTAGDNGSPWCYEPAGNRAKLKFAKKKHFCS